MYEADQINDAATALEAMTDEGTHYPELEDAVLRLDQAIRNWWKHCLPADET